MRYIKLFEGHKETSDKIEEIEKTSKKQKDEILNQYKELIDEIIVDISDYYKTESKISMCEPMNNTDRTYIDYTIKFPSSKYETFLDSLLEVVNRLKDAYGITYAIRDIFNSKNKNSVIDFSGRNVTSLRTPFDFTEYKKVLKKYLIFYFEFEEKLNKEPEFTDDIELSIVISF
jgi:hypothetical protein